MNTAAVSARSVTREVQVSPHPKELPSKRWPLSLLSGNSDTGKRILQKDWSATPPGPFETWPQSLITSITTALGEAHAGSIRVESERGVGSRFTVELPRVATE